MEENDMKSKLTEDSPFCPSCDAALAFPGLQRCSCCGMECYLEVGENHHAEQQTRLLLSWGVVLRESGELQGGRW